MAASKRRGATERENALAEVARGYLQGEMQSSIARRLGVSPPQITYDLGILRKRWQQSSAVDFNEAKGKELARLDVLEREYWAAWERSRAERTVSSSRKRDHGRQSKDGIITLLPQTEASLRKEQRDGNPAFLAGVERCIELRARILGIITGKLEVGGPGGAPIQIVEVVVERSIISLETHEK